MESKNPKANGHGKSHVEQAASELLRDGRKLANAIYEDGINKVNETEDHLKEYSDDLLRKVQENPLASVLIAGGVGFLLSIILRK
jgi:ElaB/YqjD/DUF883 family membrane-anchored ribosome-binding protein